MKQDTTGRQARITALIHEYERSGLTRAEFCLRAGIAVSTLDYYRRRYGAQESRPRLIRVVMDDKSAPAAERRFTLTLANGRRIECGSEFDDSALARLIRVAEVA